jgi:hypothetical protein
MKNQNHHFQKVARLPHMAQFDLVRNLNANDKENRTCQEDKEVRKEVCENTDSTSSIAIIGMYINKKVN